VSDLVIQTRVADDGIEYQIQVTQEEADAYEAQQKEAKAAQSAKS
jgi:hypothetical protein